MQPVDIADLNSFDARFGDSLTKQPTAKQSTRGKMSMRKRTVKKAKAQALAEDDDQENGYDNEEDYGEEYDDEDDYMVLGYSQFDIESEMLYSQQPHDMHDVILHPDYIDMVEFLERDVGNVVYYFKRKHGLEYDPEQALSQVRG